MTGVQMYACFINNETFLPVYPLLQIITNLYEKDIQVRWDLCEELLF